MSIKSRQAMIILTCRRCKGSGEIRNEQYDICMTLKSDETKRYFRIPMEHTAGEPDDLPDSECDMPKNVPCPVCEGSGKLEFDEEEWDLRVVDEEEDSS